MLNAILVLLATFPTQLAAEANQLTNVRIMLDSFTSAYGWLADGRVCANIGLDCR